MINAGSAHCQPGQLLSKASGGNFGRGITTGRCLPFKNELNIQLNFYYL